MVTLSKEDREKKAKQARQDREAKQDNRPYWNGDYKLFDPVVVRAEDLRNIFAPLRKEMDEDAELRLTSGGGAFSRAEERGMGFFDYLSSHTGVGVRQLQRYLYELEWVHLCVADLLLTRMGYLDERRTIKTYPNPRMTLESWMRWVEEKGWCIG